jgi:phosphatidylglycerophosphate synthase
MIGRIKPKIDPLLIPVVSRLIRIGMSPNGITAIGFLLGILSGVMFGMGYFIAGGVVLLLSGLCDLMDGAMAKGMNMTSMFGAFIDSVADRYSDASIFIGITWFYLWNGKELALVITTLAFLGSFMVSYTRARAESIIPKCDVGIMERPERLLLLAIGAFSGMMEEAMGILAVLSNFTALQRIIYAWKQMKKG